MVLCAASVGLCSIIDKHHPVLLLILPLTRSLDHSLSCPLTLFKSLIHVYPPEELLYVSRPARETKAGLS